VQSAWGVATLPSDAGRSTSEILESLNSQDGLEAVVIGGVDPADISAQALGQLLNTFVVSLEISHSAVTAIADVVLPVAAVTEKSGTFLDWEGRARSFDQAIDGALTRSDVRILSMIADEMQKPINLPSVTSAAKELASLGKWDGAKVTKPTVAPEAKKSAEGNNAIINSWRQLIDLGSLQAGEENLAGTARKSVAVISASRASSLGVADGDAVKVSTDRGQLVLPAHIANIADDSIWIPRNSQGSQAIATLGAASGAIVTVVKA
jgi:NADH-quinone oxidoreductase subunit G